MAQAEEPRINYIRQIKAFWEKVQTVSPLRPSAGYVYLALLERCNLRHWQEEFTVDYEKIMEICSISKNTYYDCIKDLVEKGFITYTRQENRALLGKMSITILYQNLVHEQDSTCDSSSDSTYDSSSTLIKHTKPKKPLKQINIPFDEFFKVYPVKVGKKDAESKWLILTNDQRNEIMQMLPSYVNYEQFPGWNHPNPSTFLNQKKERWKDDLGIQSKQTPATTYKPRRVIDHSKL